MYIRYAFSAAMTFESVYFFAVMIHVGVVIGYESAPAAFSGLYVRSGLSVVERPLRRQRGQQRTEQHCDQAGGNERGVGDENWGASRAASLQLWRDDLWREDRHKNSS